MGDSVPTGFLPPLTDGAAVQNWLDAFRAVHADCPDEEAIADMLEGDYSRGERWENSLLRVAPVLYVELTERGLLE